ncbi:MAG: DUF1330 domain-containing protein [Candidatus Dormibacteraeota bacterium]|uniref:DUF1330 domain-containing protein n=1 Tax=Candidatus Dormiibacter inghamiae TaxID=3127013 RepID=A0A934KEB4_9BACT|nr:DUF1330 domain-containing protein [Candidatus Dormibacteraeota bacterium]MBJ7605891.1 DUF1330 domain-containing protein [Candidatus Dormibacteraeota bacterium]
MPAYLLANVRVTYPEAYAEYSRKVPATVAAHGGRFLVRGGPGEVVEGEFSLQRLVIIEFPDRDRLRAWYDSPEYQAILPIRHANGVSTMVFLDGYSDPH